MANFVTDLSQQFTSALFMYGQSKSSYSLEGDKIISNMPTDIREALCQKMRAIVEGIIGNAPQFGEQAFLKTKIFEIMPTFYTRKKALESNFILRDFPPKDVFIELSRECRSRLENAGPVVMLQLSKIVRDKTSSERRMFLDLRPEITSEVYRNTWRFITDQIALTNFFNSSHIFFKISPALKARILEEYARENNIPLRKISPRDWSAKPALKSINGLRHYIELADGTFACSKAYSGSIELCNPDGACTKTLRNKDSRSLDFLLQLSDGTLLCGATQGPCEIWSKDGLCLDLFGQYHNKSSVCELNDFMIGLISSGNIQLWKRGERSNTPHQELKVFTTTGSAACIFTKLKDGTLAIGLENGKLGLWNGQNLSKEQWLQLHKQRITSLLELKDGTLVSGSEDKTLSFLDRNTNNVYSEHFNAPVTYLLELKNGIVAAGLQSGTIILYDRQLHFYSSLKSYFTGFLSGIEDYAPVKTILELVDGTLVSGHGHSKRVESKNVRFWNRYSCIRTFAVGKESTSYSVELDSLCELSDGTIACKSTRDNVVILMSFPLHSEAML